MNNIRKPFLIACLSIMFSQTALANNLILLRSGESFPEAMLSLQNSIKKHGYIVSRVQRVDIGLTKSGYKTDKYRIVFLGKSDEIERMINTHQELIAYLPLKISIYAENKQTVLVTLNPNVLKKFFPNKELAPVFERWAKDIEAILLETINSED